MNIQYIECLTLTKKYNLLLLLNFYKENLDKI